MTNYRFNFYTVETGMKLEAATVMELKRPCFTSRECKLIRMELCFLEEMSGKPAICCVYTDDKFSFHVAFEDNKISFVRDDNSLFINRKNSYC